MGGIPQAGGPAPQRTPVDLRVKYERDDSVMDIMGAIMIAIDGVGLQDAANALQYVLNMVHTQANDKAERSK